MFFSYSKIHNIFEVCRSVPPNCRVRVHLVAQEDLESLSSKQTAQGIWRAQRPLELLVIKGMPSPTQPLLQWALVQASPLYFHHL